MPLAKISLTIVGFLIRLIRSALQIYHKSLLCKAHHISVIKKPTYICLLLHYSTHTHTDSALLTISEEYWEKTTANISSRKSI